MEMALILMMIGSAFCTAAPLDAFPMLIVGRALQGLSVAGINVNTKTILADKVSLKENAKNTSIFALFGGLSYAVGPVIGGFLTDKTWRWCFVRRLSRSIEYRAKEAYIYKHAYGMLRDSAFGKLDAVFKLTR